MKKSIFTTRLREIMRTKDKTENYNKKTKIIKKYTQTDLANDLGYTVDTIKSWTKTNGTLPPLRTIMDIAKLFNVDTAYLLGEQPCKHHEEQTICDVTMLNEQSANILTNLSRLECEVLNNLITHSDFKSWLFSMYDFVHSHNKNTHITNSADMYNFNTEDIETHSFTKNALKYKSTELLGTIMEDIYKQNVQEENNKLALKLFSDLINLIDDAKTNNFIYFDIENECYKTDTNTNFSEFVKKQLALINSLTNNQIKLYQYHNY